MRQPRRTKDYTVLEGAARLLFLEGYNGSEIADVLGVSDNTVSKWREAGKWDEARTSRHDLEQDNVASVQRLLKYNLSVLEARTAKFNEMPLEERPMIDKKDMDAINRTLSGLRNTSITFSLASRFSRQLLQVIFAADVELAKRVQPYHADYIMSIKDATLE